MTNAELEALLGRFIDQRITELEQAVQGVLTADDPEEVLNAALSDPADSDVIETFSDRVNMPEPDGPWIEELGRRISREESAWLLENWKGSLADQTKHEAPEIADGETAAAELQRLWEADRKAYQEQHEANERRFSGSTVAATPSAR